MWKASKKSRWSDPLTAATAVGGSGIGVLLMYFFDPQSGRRRRHVVRDRTFAFFRRIGRGIARLGRRQQSYAYGLSQRALHLREQDKPGMDDITLTRKVETEIFRDAGSPKGQVNVNVEDGVVFLRGEVQTPEQYDEVERDARRVKGVRDVHNLLHLPGQPAPL
jgi:hypothetical protein